MVIIFYAADTHCCGHIRGEELARVVNGKGQDSIIVKTNVMKSDFGLADVMVFQRQMTETVYDKMMYAKSLGIRTVYDIDDNLMEVPDNLGDVSDALAKPEIAQCIIKFLRGADLVTTASASLAYAARKYCDTPVCVLKNGICIEDWKKTESHSNAPVIGWMGSRTHIADAEMVSDPLRQVMQDTDARLKLIGWVGEKEFPWLKDFSGRVDVIDWVEINSLPAVMADLDIGIAPLINTYFNQCKSSIKWMQYSALGIPAVVSPIPPYIEDVEHLRNGVFAGSQEDWYYQIKWLVEHPHARAVVGGNALKDVTEKHTTTHRAAELLAVCRELGK